MRSERLLSSNFIGYDFAVAHNILYSFRRCPYAMRARLALQVSAQPCELREVVLKNKPELLLRISPKGTVPVLVCGDLVVDQSLDIMLWSLKQNDPQRWLVPSEGTREQMFLLLGRLEGEFKFHLDRYKYPQRYEGVDPSEHRAWAGQFLTELDQRLRSTLWLVGNRISLADVALAPFVRQFANTDRAWFDLEPWGALRRWLDDFLSSPLFESVMEKYPAWQPGDQITIFPHNNVTSWQRLLP